MSHRHLLTLLLLLLAFAAAQAQTAGSHATGRVLDADTRETLPGATLFCKVSFRGTVADEQGRYELSWTGRPDTLRVSYVGYESQFVYIDEKFTGRDFSLKPISLREVVIEDKRSPEAKVRSAQMGLEELSAKDAAKLPALFGEVDLLKVLQLKPGVQSGGEGMSGLYVRGGGPDQNLFLVDDVPIYNPSHLFGFFSTFSADAVQSIDLYKGTFPAQYGGRLSSVVDVKMRTANKDSGYKFQGGIGLISSRFTVEGPIKKGSSSFIFSGRRTYFDIFTRQYNKIKLKQNDPEFDPIPDYYFHDLNGKLSFDVTPRDKLFITGYLGQDQFHFARNRFAFKLNWGNKLASATLVHKHSRLMFSEATVFYSEYNYKVQNAFDSFRASLGSGISDAGARFSWNYTGLDRHTIQAGMAGTRHSFVIGRLQAGSGDGYSYSSGQYLQADEFGIFLNDEVKVSTRTQLNAGLRVSGFQNGSTVYYAFEARMSSVYMLDEMTSLKLSYNRAAQYLNLVSSSGVSLPNDLWYPSNSIVKPQISQQIAAGYSKALFSKKYFFSLEAYYKKLDRQIDFKDGANLLTNQSLDTTFVFGKGWAYGAEAYIEKKLGRTTGWIGYTLSWTFRQFDAINEGRRFFPRYDRRHDLNIVVSHQLNKRVHVAGTFVFGSGNAVSIPYGRSFVQDVPGTVSNPPGYSVVPLYAGRNNYRMAPYHRVDVSLLYKVGKRRRGELAFSIYNLYGRMNPYFIYVETKTENPDGSGKIEGFQAKQVSLFPMIPSVTYNFRF